MEILEKMIENENTEEEIEQWTENHRAAVAIYDAPIEEIAKRIVVLKREKEADDAEHKERRIQRRLEEERRILEMQMQMKKKWITQTLRNAVFGKNLPLPHPPCNSP